MQPTAASRPRLILGTTNLGGKGCQKRTPSAPAYFNDAQPQARLGRIHPSGEILGWPTCAGRMRSGWPPW